MRGKVHEIGSGSLPVYGSPPPMRGKACQLLRHRRFCRITPAYAGKSYVLEDAECKN